MTRFSHSYFAAGAFVLGNRRRGGRTEKSAPNQCRMTPSHLELPEPTHKGCSLRALLCPLTNEYRTTARVPARASRRCDPVQRLARKGRGSRPGKLLLPSTRCSKRTGRAIADAARGTESVPCNLSHMMDLHGANASFRNCKSSPVTGKLA